MLFSTVIALAIKNARRCERRIRFVSLASPSGLFTCWLPGSPLVSIGACAVHLGTCSKCALAAHSRHTRTLPREAGCSSATDDNAGLGIGSNSVRERSRKETEPAAPPESRASISRHATLAILLCVLSLPVNCVHVSRSPPRARHTAMHSCSREERRC